jgi:hypothetical protein
VIVATWVLAAVTLLGVVVSNRKRLKKQVRKITPVFRAEGGRADLQDIDITGDVGPQVAVKNTDLRIRGYTARRTPDGGVHAAVRFMQFGKKESR